MNRIGRAILCMIGIACIAGTATGAEKLFTGKIGFCWPQALLATASPSGDAELAYGYVIDKKVGFGIAADFLWNVNSKTAPSSGGHVLTIREQQTYMFPIMFFFQLDPMPELIVHPVGHFDIGYNSMIYSYTATDANTGESTPLHPYFNGLIIKTGVDALYDMGKQSAIYLGLEFQWANTSTASTPAGIFDKRDMSGIGLSAGFRVEL